MKRLVGWLAVGAWCLMTGCASDPKPRFEGIYDLNRTDCRVGVYADCDSEYLSRNVFDRAEIVPYEDMRDAVRQLLDERIDAFVFDEHVLRLIQWHHPERFRILEQPLDTDPSVIAVSSRCPELVPEFNRFIANYRSSGLYDEMFMRWCHDPERRPSDIPDISKVICKDPNAKPLRIGVDPIQEPNAFIDRQGRLVGFDIEFAYRFGRAEKYRVSFVEDSEDELFNLLERGEIDVIISNLGKDLTRKGVLWTDGYLDSDVMIMVKERD